MGQAVVFLVLVACAAAYGKLTTGHRSGLRARTLVGTVAEVAAQSLGVPGGPASAAVPAVAAGVALPPGPHEVEAATAATAAPAASSTQHPDEGTVRRVVLPPPVSAPRFLFVAEDGTSFEVAARTLIGRNPTSDGGPSAVVLLEDDSMSISKTHAVLDIVNGECWVEDRHSTNGTSVIRGDGGAEVVRGGEWARLTVGCALRLGERTFTLVDPSDDG